MQTFLNRFFVFLFICTLSGCATQSNINQAKHQAESSQFIKEWLVAVDHQDKDKLWQLTSQSVKSRFEKDFMLKIWLGMQPPFGKRIKAEEQLNWVFNDKEVIYPDGVYRRIVYWMEYEKKQRSRHQFIVALENGKWKLVEWKLVKIIYKLNKY